MQLDDATIVLSQADFFDICDDEQQRLLAFASERRIFAPDEVLYQSGNIPEGAHVLISGRLRAEPEGESPDHGFVIETVGSVVSAMAMMLPKARLLTITAITEVDTLFVPRTAFMKLLRQSPDLARRAVARVEEDLMSYLGALEPVRQRIRNEKPE